MKTTTIREELLSQHEGLRARARDARLVADRWARGEATAHQVRDVLAGLADALRSHNLREERALRALIDASGGRGALSTRIMDDEHIGEHRETFDALIRVNQATDPSEGARDLEVFCGRLLDHMAWEEKAFLNAAVLGDAA